MDKIELKNRTKADVRSVLITSQKGLVLPDFVKIFRELTSSNVPFRRLGYDCLESFLLDSPDVCTCHRLVDGSLVLHAVCDKSTEHVKRLVDRSRCQTRRSGSFTPSRSRRSEPVAPSLPPRHRYNLVTLLTRYPQGVCVDDLAGVYQAECGVTLNHVSFGFPTLEALIFSMGHHVRTKMTPVGLKVFPAALLSERVGTGANFTADVSCSTRSFATPVKNRKSFVEYADTLNPLKSDLVATLKSLSKPLPLSDLPEHFLREQGRKLQFLQLGFTGLLEAISQMGAPLAVEKIDGLWYCHVTEDRAQVPVPPPPPVDVSKPLNLADSEFCGDVQHADDEQFSSSGKVSRVKVRLPAELIDTATPPAPVSEPENTTPCRVSPPQPVCEVDVVSMSHRYHSQPPSRLEHGQQALDKNNFPLLFVNIVKVDSPGQFVFSTCEWCDRLNRLSETMARVYGDDSHVRQQLLLGNRARSLLGNSVSVVVRHDNQWWRATVVSKLRDKLTVMLVDVARTVSVGYGDVFQLLSCFGDLPVLCSQGSLADVQPASCRTVWSTQATRRFSRFFTPSLSVAASVLQQTEMCNVLRICDTSSKDDVFVAELLVNDGHAIPSNTDYTAPLDTPLRAILPTELSMLYTLMDGVRPSPEGEEPLSESSAHVGMCTTDNSGNLTDKPHTTDDSQRQIIVLKAECYDLQQKLASPVSSRSATMYRNRLSFLQRKLETLQLPA